MGVVLPFRKKERTKAGFRLHAEGRTFEVEASEQSVPEVYALGFDTGQGFVSAVSHAQSHARSLGLKEPMRIYIRPSRVSGDS